MRSALPAVAAVALVVLAGCGGSPIPNPNPTPEPGTTTESTARAPTTGPTATTASPPGVTDGVLEDADALVRAHRSHVHDQGAVTEVVLNMTGRADNRTVNVVVEETWRATPGLTRIAHTWRQTSVGPNGSTTASRIRQYANETAVVTREAEHGNATTRTETRDDGHDELLLAQVATDPMLDRAFETGNFTVTGTERRNGRTVTTLEAFDETLTDDGRTVFAATVDVTASGRVLSASITRDRHANRPEGRRTIEVSVANGTSVDRPAWVENATTSQ